MLIQDRIKLIIKANNETPSSFADTIGIKRSNLSHVLSGRNKPSLDFLSKIIISYPKVNASWLVTGDVREGDFSESDSSHKQKDVEPLDSAQIERVVVFYKDGTFKEYKPSGQ